MPKKIKNTIRKLSISKAVGLNRILNKAIKAVLKAVTTPLANTTTTYLFKNNLLKYYKDTIIVILQKINKKNYSLLRSY